MGGEVGGLGLGSFGSEEGEASVFSLMWKVMPSAKNRGRWGRWDGGMAGRRHTEQR